MPRKQHRGSGIEAFCRSHTRRLQVAGLAVEEFCLTMDPPVPRIDPLSGMPPVIAICESR
jgi:hypothetical protein